MGLGRFKSKKSCRQPGGEHRKKSDLIAELLKFYINLCASQCISHSWKPYRKPETLRGSSHSNLVMFGLPLGKGGNVRTATEQVGGHSLGTLTEKDTFQMANDMTSNVITMMRMITNSSGLIPSFTDALSTTTMASWRGSIPHFLLARTWCPAAEATWRGLAILVTRQGAVSSVHIQDDWRAAIVVFKIENELHPWYNATSCS